MKTIALMILSAAATASQMPPSVEDNNELGSADNIATTSVQVD